MSHTESYPTHKKDLEFYNEVLNFRQNVARLITYDNDEGTDTLSHFARHCARNILKYDEADFGILMRDLPRTAYGESEYTDE